MRDGQHDPAISRSDGDAGTAALVDPAPALAGCALPVPRRRAPRPTSRRPAPGPLATDRGWPTTWARHTVRQVTTQAVDARMLDSRR